MVQVEADAGGDPVGFLEDPNAKILVMRTSCRSQGDSALLERFANVDVVSRRSQRIPQPPLYSPPMEDPGHACSLRGSCGESDRASVMVVEEILAIREDIQQGGMEICPILAGSPGKGLELRWLA